MKKTITFLSLILVLQAGAQSYQRMLADSVTSFRIAMLMPGVRLEQSQSSSCINVQYMDCTMQYDSIYNGKTYKKVHLYNWGPLTGLIREDTLAKKVYFIPYCSTTEDLLYDFSLQQGDSMNYILPNSNQFPMKDGWYKVDSIRMRHDYTTYYRRHFYLSNRLNQNTSNGRRASLEMIEGVGSTIHPLFLYANFYNFGDLSWLGQCVNTDFDELVTCKWDNGTKVYFDSCAYMAAQNSNCVNHNDSCNYMNQCGNIREFDGQASVRVYPNPATDQAQVEINVKDPGTLTLSISNAIGLPVKEISLRQGANTATHQVDLSGLPEGIYFLHLNGSKRPAAKVMRVNAGH